MKKLALMSILLIILVPLFYGCSDDDNGDDNGNGNGDTLQAGDLYVDVYDSTKAYNGTTILSDIHDMDNPRIVEVDMHGEIVWEFVIPESLRSTAYVGLDSKLLDNGNILMVISQQGVYEIDRDGNIVWSRNDPKCSHDVDRLDNGNTIYVYGANDLMTDAHVKEVDSDGNIVWTWFAQDHLDFPPYDTIDCQGWTHTNSVTRMENGHTLINPRNFSITIEVDSLGEIVWQYDWTELYPTDYPKMHDPHEPELQSDGNLLICLQWESPYQVVEIDRATGEPVWEYHRDNLRTCRDCDRLPNGNTLIVGVLTDTLEEESVIFEVTPDKEIVWQLKIHATPAVGQPGWFYRAQRIGE